ncbi:uncharacterized protein BP5553_09380 [Venustampulla echinocandica]|uniref:OTU domain-containing protein n=1 Tax=Venustampulla echinocandica TaxID=2656787 RepID=A0A370TCK5_9HELO|nr:uncharacterized protein BP5553_09380 [Venustampulla echinocandica]RDL31978.1 hypothetical protein BP5553_09380 [Venustampulla echinocandica]
MGRCEEFPLLKLYGLKAVNILGDGNCLFNALSDQIYGHQGRHSEIRQRVIKEMRENPEPYKPFIDVNQGGGQRRNPKRKNVGASSSSFMYAPPTPQQIDAAWEARLQQMAGSGTYGDNIEIQAFTKAYNTDVRIFNHNNTNYWVRAEQDGVARPMAYIAYHNWEHYSSVRNIQGPFSGLPNIDIKDISDEEAASAKEKLPKGPAIQEWMIDVVKNSLPSYADEETIRKALVDNNGSVDNAVNQLLDVQEYSSAPPTPGSLSQSVSSSVERDADSDDDEIHGPNKRQNRRASRATKALRKEQREREAELQAIPALELPLPDSGASTELSVEPNEDNIDKSAIQKKNSEDEEFGPSDDNDQSEADDSGSDYTGSSQSPSGANITPSTRPKIILNTKNNTKGKDASAAKIPHRPNPKKKTLITARQRKEMKKQAQKQAAKERKRAKGQGNGQLARPTDHSKRDSPPMEKVLSLGKLSMIQV